MVVAHGSAQRIRMQPKVAVHAASRCAARWRRSVRSMQHPRPISHALCCGAAQLPRRLLAAGRWHDTPLRILLLLLLVRAAGAAAFQQRPARRRVTSCRHRLLLAAAATGLEQWDAASSGGCKLRHRELLAASAAVPATLHLL